MKGLHHYHLTVEWTGNKGTGTSSYTAYDRSHTIQIEGKKEILGTSDPSFRGDKTKHNPEDLFLASLSACHMLWYLHLCAEAGVVVVDYKDNATGTMQETADGGGHFTEVILHPHVTVQDVSMVHMAHALHEKAHSFCLLPIPAISPCCTKPTWLHRSMILFKALFSPF